MFQTKTEGTITTRSGGVVYQARRGGGAAGGLTVDAEKTNSAAVGDNCRPEAPSGPKGGGWVAIDKIPAKTKRSKICPSLSFVPVGTNRVKESAIRQHRHLQTRSDKRATVKSSDPVRYHG